MPGKPLPSVYIPVLQVLIIAGCGSLAHGQLGQRYSRPSSFYLPSQQLGIIGGQYTRYDYSVLSAPAASSSIGGPLSLDLSAGGRSFSPSTVGAPLQRPAAGPGLLTGRPSVQWMAQPAARLSGRVSAHATTPGPILPGYPSPPSVPQAAWFQPVLSPDLAGELPDRRRINLDKITPDGLSPRALEAAGQAAASPAATAADPAMTANTLKELVNSRATELTRRGEDCLAEGLKALQAGRIRTDRPSRGTVTWGAIDWFERARLLSGDQPEPTLGLLASLVSVSDCNQAAALVGPLVRRWPRVLADPAVFDRFYTGSAQVRVHLLIVRQAVAHRPDPELRLLAAFYGWFAENRQQALSEVEQVARLQGPDSQAAALARIMRENLASQTP